MKRTLQTLTPDEFARTIVANEEEAAAEYGRAVGKGFERDYEQLVERGCPFCGRHNGIIAFTMASVDIPAPAGGTFQNVFGPVCTKCTESFNDSDIEELFAISRLVSRHIAGSIALHSPIDSYVKGDTSFFDGVEKGQEYLDQITEALDHVTSLIAPSAGDEDMPDYAKAIFKASFKAAKSAEAKLEKFLAEAGEEE
jgi:hypothetical protein